MPADRAPRLRSSADGELGGRGVVRASPAESGVTTVARSVPSRSEPCRLEQIQKQIGRRTDRLRRSLGAHEGCGEIRSEAPPTAAKQFTARKAVSTPGAFGSDSRMPSMCGPRSRAEIALRPRASVRTAISAVTIASPAAISSIPQTDRSRVRSWLKIS